MQGNDAIARPADQTDQIPELDIDKIDQFLKAINRDDDPSEYARLAKLKVDYARRLNSKGLTLFSEEKYSEADDAFREAAIHADPPLKCKILINQAKNNLFNKQLDSALENISKAAVLTKELKRPQNTLLLGYSHMLRGQVFYRLQKHKLALSEFMTAEHTFEGAGDLSGVGLSCMEICRIHIHNKNMAPAWHYLKKSENCLRTLGEKEAMGVTVCKAFALLHSGKEIEARALLQTAYKSHQGFGLGNYLLPNVLDAYLYADSKSLRFQEHLV